MADHECNADWFDRAICPDPCGNMHTCCSECGAAMDWCVHEDGPR